MTGVTAGVVLALLGSAACGSSGGSGSAPSKFTLLTNVENTTVKTQLADLAKSSCSSAAKALPLKVDTVPQTSLDQKLQLLSGQNALPVMFAAGNSPTLTAQLAKAGQVEDLEPVLKKEGVWNDISPAAVSTIKALYGGKMNVLPTEFNIEGIFYNKKLFQQHGVSVPSTWDELVADAAKFKAAGVQPFSASGQQGWPITRLIGDYLFRSIGPDALKDVADGKAKLTDPEYVKAAQAVADLGAKGYFGQGVGSIDYDTAFNTFLTGKAAMFYMGSWALANIADPKQDKIGASNIGFMPFPSVAGGKGSVDQYPSNVGLPFAIGAKTYDDKVGAWLKCIAQNYGSAAFKSAGSISGFKFNTPVSDPNPVSAQVRNTISKSTSSVLWFEALMGTKATTTSQQDAAPLVTGAMSASAFMSAVQSALAQ